MSVIGSNIIAGASGTVETGYQISRSLRFNSADSAKLTRTPASAGNRKTWTWSGWVKRTTLGDQYVFEVPDGGSTGFHIRFNASDQLRINDYTVGTDYTFLLSSAVYRDVSAWYHIVVAFDTTQATSSNRAKVYVNGVQVTAFSSSTYPNQNQDTAVNSTKAHEYSSGNKYLADAILIDGQALTPSSFGETDSATGVWVPKAYTGTYGTNGFWLKFDDNSNTTAATLGKDSSGNGNNWTPNNFSVTAGVGNDSLVDSPTNYGTDTGVGGEVRGNYCTLNPLFNLDNGRNTVSDGNLKTFSGPGDTAGVYTSGTFAIPAGKWYWEGLYYQSADPGYNAGIGLGTTNTDTGRITYNYSGTKTSGGSTTSYGAAYVSGDIIGVAMDMDAGSISFYKNGVSQGVAVTGISGTVFPMFLQIRTNTVSGGWTANFGQRPFAYTAPSGFKALNTQNLPTPAVGASASTLASKNFDADIYTGTGATQSRTLAFQPDFLWFKIRSGAANHVLIDSVRGTSPFLISNSTGAEATATDQVTSFNSNGYTLGANTTGGSVNVNGSTYVGWAWKGGGTGVSNTAGSITSTVSANTTAGISVATFAAPASGTATIGHGLGVAPKMVIVKSRAAAYDWIVYHESAGNTKALRLNLTNAADTNSIWWNNTSPTSSVFTLGSAYNGGGNSVAYCFAEIAGFSKFGSYTGNGSTDGPFVFLGLRARWILVKRTDVARDWVLIDTARAPYNLVSPQLFPNSSAAEDTTVQPADILSNGFKLRTTDASWNASSGTYIFMAFAEFPFQYARAR